MKIAATKIVEVEAKTLKIHVKCSDLFTADLVDQDGSVIKSHEGYVPDFMPGSHYGDYIILDVDIDSGKIVNWQTPTQRQLEDFINGDES